MDPNVVKQILDDKPQAKTGPIHLAISFVTSTAETRCGITVPSDQGTTLIRQVTCAKCLM